MRILKNIYDRTAFEIEWLLENTWCDACNEADLGLIDPMEFEEDGGRFIEGNCRKCGNHVISKIADEE